MVCRCGWVIAGLFGFSAILRSDRLLVDCRPTGPHGVCVSSEEAALQKFGYKQELSRSLSMTDLVIYGMIFMVPIAPFAVYGVVYKDAKGMVPLAYLLG